MKKIPVWLLLGLGVIFFSACGGSSASSPADAGTDADAADDAAADADADAGGDTPGENAWEPVAFAGEIWEPRAGFAVVVHAGRIWVMGGMVARDGRPAVTDDVWASSDGIAWELIKPADGSAWCPRANFAAFSTGDRIWVMSDN